MVVLILFLIAMALSIWGIFHSHESHRDMRARDIDCNAALISFYKAMAIARVNILGAIASSITIWGAVRQRLEKN